MPGLLQKYVNNRAPIPFIRKGGSGFGFNLDGGVGVGRGRQLEQMEKVSALFSIIDLISSAVARVDWHLYRRSNTVAKADRTEIFDHPALVVWETPASVDGQILYTQDEFVEALQQHYELTGEMNVVLERRSSRQFSAITDMWPVRPDRITPVKSRDRFISGYLYTLGDEEVPLTPDQVIVEKRQNPVNPWRGASPIAALMPDIEGEKAAAIYNWNFFVNGAVPGGILELGNDALMGDREWQAMRDRWATQHQGVSNAHRIAVMEMGKFVERKLSQRDMEFTDLRNFSKEAMLRAYRVSPAMLGEVEDVNRSTAEAQQVIFAEQVVVPRLERWKKLLNEKLLPRMGALGEGVEFDYDSPVPQNAADLRLNERADVLNARALLEMGGAWEETLEAFNLPNLPRDFVPPGLTGSNEQGSSEPVNVEPGGADTQDQGGDAG